MLDSGKQTERLNMAKTKKKVSSPEISHVTLVNQGSWTWLSKYEIIRHRRFAGDTGFIEVIEVKNPPPDKGRFFIHDYHGYAEVSSFSEWKTLDNALHAFDRTSGLVLYIARKMYIELGGFIQMTDCKPKEDPWFYET
jgi:hypothetical protein